MLGLSGGRPTYGCPYCCGKQDETTGEYVKGVNRTLGDCKASHAEYVAVKCQEGRGKPVLQLPGVTH